LGRRSGGTRPTYACGLDALIFHMTTCEWCMTKFSRPNHSEKNEYYNPIIPPILRSRSNNLHRRQTPQPEHMPSIQAYMQKICGINPRSIKPSRGTKLISQQVEATCIYNTLRKTHCMTETLTLRLSEREKQELRRLGRLSDVVREAIRLYLRTKNSKRIISRLKELQKTPLKTSVEEDLRLIRADRGR